jgi:hypothetical protein
VRETEIMVNRKAAMEISAEDYAALVNAAEHGLSLMLSRSGDDGPLRLYHRCEGCERALRLLQAMGKYPDATLAEYVSGEPPGESSQPKD